MDLKFPGAYKSGHKSFHQDTPQNYITPDSPPESKRKIFLLEVQAEVCQN